MLRTGKYVVSMAKMVPVRNVPESLQRKLKARAAGQGVSLSDLSLKEIEQLAERPSVKELAAGIGGRTPVKYKISPAAIIREERYRRCW